MEAPDDELLTAVLAASRSLVAIAAASIESAPVEVTLAQFRALSVLVNEGPTGMSDLSKALKLSPSSTSRLVERLERKDLAHRQMSPVSRRAIEVHLADAGRELVEVVLARRRQEVTAVLSAVPPGRRQALLQAFEDFAAAAAEPLRTGPVPTADRAT